MSSKRNRNAPRPIRVAPRPTASDVRLQQAATRQTIAALAATLEEEEEELLDGEEEYGDTDSGPSDAAVEYTAQSYTQGKLINVPSGGALRIRPFSLISALKRGSMPSHLVAAAREMINGPDDKLAELRRRQEQRARNASQQSSPKDREAEKIDGQFAVMDFMITKMVASFRVVEKAPEECEEDEVSIEMIFEADKICLISYAMQGQRALEDFR